jgi:hypothetical protein
MSSSGAQSRPAAPAEDGAEGRDRRHAAGFPAAGNRSQTGLLLGEPHVGVAEHDRHSRACRVPWIVRRTVKNVPECIDLDLMMRTNDEEKNRQEVCPPWVFPRCL